MVFKAMYKMIYTVDGNIRELLVEVNLIKNDFPLKPRDNIYKGIAIVNGQYYDKIDLSHTVNALYSAEEIGLNLKNEIKKKCRFENKTFRLKKEELYEIPIENLKKKN